MAIGFRKSLFGFHTGDVINYIESNQKQQYEKEETLKKQYQELREELAKLQNDFTALSAERDEISAQLQEYNEKYEEINRLSENIGKLYLVAQANAQAIMKNSTEINEKAIEETQRNLTSIENAQQSLDGIRRELVDTSSKFSARVNELIASLNSARTHINKTNADSAQHTADFNAVFETIVK